MQTLQKLVLFLIVQQSMFSLSLQNYMYEHKAYCSLKRLCQLALSVFFKQY